MFYVYGGSEMVLALAVWNRISVHDAHAKQGLLEEQEEPKAGVRNSVALEQAQRQSCGMASRTSLPPVSMSRSSMRPSEIRPQSTTSKVTYCSLLNSGRYIMAAFSPGMQWAHFVIMEPILAQHLLSLGMPTMQRGIIFCVFPFFYSFNCFTMHATTPAFLEKRTRIIFGWLVTSVGFFCIGPSLLLNFPNKLWIMILG